MITIDEIRDIKNYLVNDYHSARVARQLEMQNYYEDKFRVPMIKEPKYISRTGSAAWLVDAPAAHIITSNPQIFINPKIENNKAREAARNVNSLLNHWVKRVLKQSPQPIKEFTKNLLLRGEAWIHPSFNEFWDANNINDKYIPMNFGVPDPINIYGSPEECYGIPDYVIVSFKVSRKMIEYMHPELDLQTDNKVIDYFEYYDKDVRYFEAANIPLLDDGIQENVCGLVPFIHAYSGFGKSSSEGKPETLTIGRLDKVTDLLIQECAINSDIDSCLHKFAHERLDLIIPQGAEFNDRQIKENYDAGAGAFNILPLPEGSKITAGERILPSQEAFQHFANIRSRLQMEAPPIMAGLPSGTSGRQEDIVGYRFIRRFDCIVEAVEDAWGKAMDMGLLLMERVPTWLPITMYLEQPDGAKKQVKIDLEDIKLCTDTVLKLKTADPIEDDRKLMAGRTLVNDGRIDWETFLVEYAGYTPERANEIITKTIASNVINQALLPFIGRKALEKLGMTEELAQLDREQELQKEMNQKLSEKSAIGQSPQSGAGSRGGEPRNMNIQSPQGREMVDMALTQSGVRSSAS